MCICLTESTPEQHLRILQQYEPDFILHVDLARQKQAAVTLALDGYRNTKAIVWSCLWYAMEQGVMVTVVPKVMALPHPTGSTEDAHPSDTDSSGARHQTALQNAPKKNPHRN